MSSFFELKLLCLAALLLACGIAAGGDQAVLTLQAATELVVQDNPDLAQIQARAQAMAAIPSQEGALPDPQISFNAMNLPVDTFNIHQADMTQVGAGVSQAIPFPGKLALREQAAAFEAEAASQRTRAVGVWQAVGFGVHCKNLIQIYSQAAEENLEMAKMCKQQAKEIKQ